MGEHKVEENQELHKQEGSVLPPGYDHKKFFEQEGIRLPPGYSQMKGSVPPFEMKGGENPQKLRTSMKEKLLFAFDPENSEYIKFLQQCRNDTKLFNESLSQELKKRGMPVWIKRNKIPKNKSAYRKMGILIRPPFFSSGENKTTETRMQEDNEKDNFILHVDQEHNVQCIRWWRIQNAKDISTGLIKTRFRELFEKHLENEKEFLKAHYGNWPVLASRIVDIIQGIEQLLKEHPGP